MEPYFCEKCRVTHTKGKIYKNYLINAQLESYTKSQLKEIERVRSSESIKMNFERMTKG